MEPQAALGFAHFIGQTDSIGRAILAVLVLMSVITWYVVLVKLGSGVLAHRRTERFLSDFWTATSLRALALTMEKHGADEPFSNVTRRALAVARHHESAVKAEQHDAAGNEFVMRGIRRALDEETTRMQSGLAVLASVGSTAPFVGLLGTVWGVYQALLSIGMSGQGTLDKVAGPVGEALIMTGLGLAVAIPAVLAYNFAVRSNRVLLARVDAFAHDLFTLIATGSHIARESDRTPPRAAAAGGVA